MDALVVVECVASEFIRQLAWTSPDVTEAVLWAVATVPFRNDVEAYLHDAMPVAVQAFTRAMQPQIDAAEAEVAALRAENAALSARHERFLREFEAFRQMRIPKTIQ